MESQIWTPRGSAARKGAQVTPTQRSGDPTQRSPELARSPASARLESAGEATSLAGPTPPAAGALEVEIGGRIVVVEACHAGRLADLQAALRSQLGAAAQAFDLTDGAGNPLLTDARLLQAVRQGAAPLRAAPAADESVQDIEARREELAQMQWKLVQDQISMAVSKMGAVERQVSELHQQLEAVTRDYQDRSEGLRAELGQLVEAGRDATHNEVRQLCERVNACAQVVQCERNRREQLQSNLSNRLQEVHSLLEQERSARAVAAEEAHKELKELAHDASAMMAADTCGSQAEALRQSTQEIGATVKQLSRQVALAKKEADGHRSIVEARLADIEERCTALEAHDPSVVSILSPAAPERSQLVTDGRVRSLDARKAKEDSDDAVRLDDSQSPVSAREELPSREERVRQSRQSWLAEQTRQIAELEKRLAERMERECQEREKSVQRILGEVTKALEASRQRVAEAEKERKAAMSVKAASSSGNRTPPVSCAGSATVVTSGRGSVSPPHPSAFAAAPSSGAATPSAPVVRTSSPIVRTSSGSTVRPAIVITAASALTPRTSLTAASAVGSAQRSHSPVSTALVRCHSPISHWPVAVGRTSVGAGAEVIVPPQTLTTILPQGKECL